MKLQDINIYSRFIADPTHVLIVTANKKDLFLGFVTLANTRFRFRTLNLRVKAKNYLLFGCNGGRRDWSLQSQKKVHGDSRNADSLKQSLSSPQKEAGPDAHLLPLEEVFKPKSMGETL